MNRKRSKRLSLIIIIVMDNEPKKWRLRFSDCDVSSATFFVGCTGKWIGRFYLLHNEEKPQAPIISTGTKGIFWVEIQGLLQLTWTA
mmetsp:Transcript_105115/g.206185  ORF Transcript_105115/g.206185 Transcript_105115/m.206185 type:complete len:87 (+) Transcript_105115:65-325(+)